MFIYHLLINSELAQTRTEMSFPERGRGCGKTPERS
jgi:hypothetical protein